MSSDAPTETRVLRSSWRPHPGQAAVMQHDARFRIVAAGRRFGKSEMCAHLAVKFGLENPNSTIWWVAPRYQDSNEYGFDNIRPLLTDDLLADEPKRSKPRKIPLVTGSEISFRSAEREDSLRGGGVDLLIVDESATVKDRAWTEELRPTLSDTLGKLVAIGTPKGRSGWFWRWFQRGQDPEEDDIASWAASTYLNPHVPNSEIDDARDDMPDRIWEQEYLAQFKAGASGVFDPTDIEAITADYSVPLSKSDPQVAGSFFIGVDFARAKNYTAIVVLDTEATVVALDRLRRTSWSRIQDRIERFAADYSPCTVALDATRDNKIVSDLEAVVANVHPVTFSAKTKRTLVENLITRVEAGDLTLPDPDRDGEAAQLRRELDMFEYDMSPRSRNVSYSAPEGHHDDLIDALALAAEGSRNRPTRSITRRGTPDQLYHQSAERDDDGDGDDNEGSGSAKRIVRRRSLSLSIRSGTSPSSDRERKCKAADEKREWFGR